MSQEEIDAILKTPKDKQDVMVTVKIRINLNALEALAAESKRKGKKTVEALIEAYAAQCELKDK